MVDVSVEVKFTVKTCGRMTSAAGNSRATAGQAEKIIIGVHPFVGVVDGNLVPGIKVVIDFRVELHAVGIESGSGGDAIIPSEFPRQAHCFTAVLSPSPPSKVLACGMAARNFWLVPEGSNFGRFASHGVPPEGTKSEQSALAAPPVQRTRAKHTEVLQLTRIRGAVRIDCGTNRIAERIDGRDRRLAPVLTVCVLILPDLQPDQ